MTTAIETCGVGPPAAAAAELSVPLCFQDLNWVHFPPTQRLIFYDHHFSESEFLNDVLPKLKQSLSLTLKYYLPVAGNLLYPSNIEKKPIIRYVSGDTAPLTVAVSSLDFDELTGNHARDSNQFYDFIPEMPAVREEGEYKLVPLIALQLTLFSGRGICIGVSNHHCLGDARSVAGFMLAWAEINKSGGGEEEFLSRNGGSLPFFDRSVFGDCSELDRMYWNAKRNIPFTPSSSSSPLPSNRVRASFTLHRSKTEKLKSLFLSNNPSRVHVSSFIVTAAYVWSCLVKSAAVAGEEVGGDEPELFFCPADARGRLNALVDPPVPVNYFGNCLGAAIVSVAHKEVAADDGFLVAATAVADQIDEQVNNKYNFLKAFGDMLSKIPKVMKTNPFGVSGSPKFDLSNADFGWGKGKKVEVLSLDRSKNFVSLSNGDGGLVVGLSLPRNRMEVFAAIFENGLNL